MSDSEQAAEPNGPVQLLSVLYCDICKFPPEYCEFGSSLTRCKAWLQENHPDLYEKYYSEDALEGKIGSLSVEAEAKISKDVAKKEAKAEAKADLASKKKSEAQVVIKRQERTKRKHVTIVTGLEQLDMTDLKKIAKLFAQRFATGSSVSKNVQGADEIVIQGDVADDVEDMLLAGTGALKVVKQANISRVEEKKKKAEE